MATRDDAADKRKVLAREVFDFFLSNAKTWPQNPEYLPMYDLSKKSKNTLYLNLNVKKAIVTLAYVFRFECRKKFREMSDDLKNVENYKNYVMSCGIREKHLFLAWIAFLLELTTYCYLKDYNYSETGKQCLLEYSEKILSCECEWETFNSTASDIDHFYDKLITSFSGKFPESDIMAPFLKRLGDILKYYKYEKNKRGMKNCRQKNVDYVSEKFPTKLRDLSLSPHDLDIIKFGFLIKRKSECPGKLRGKQKMCSLNSKNSMSRKMKTKYCNKSEDDIMCNISSQNKNLTVSGDSASDLGGKSGHKAKDLSLVASAGSCLHLNKSQTQVNELKGCAAKSDEINHVIVITDSYLKNIRDKMMNAQKQNCKIDIKVYSPSKKIANVVENLDDVFINNIDDESNISKIAEGLYAVGPQKWEDYELIVLNSASSSEDEYEFDTSQLSLMHNVYKTWESTDTGFILLMKRLIECRVWEEKIDATLQTLSENCSGACSEALDRTKLSVQPQYGNSSENANADLSSELNEKNLPESNRRKVIRGQKREWRKKPVYRD